MSDSKNISTANIHPTAIVDGSVTVSDGVTIGPWSVIGPNVVIGENTQIASHVVIQSNTRIGKNNRIYPFASIACDPQDLSYHGEQTWLEIGDENIIREYVSINRGSVKGRGTTTIGNKNCIMAYSHIAHDCILGDEIQMVNNATLAGHVIVEDYVICGAFTAVHQFCRIGAYTFLSRATQITKDIPPYLMIKGIPGAPCGLNKVGLQRRGFSDQVLRDIREAYQIMYRRQLQFDDVLTQLKALAEKQPAVLPMWEMMVNSERGIPRKVAD